MRRQVVEVARHLDVASLLGAVGLDVVRELAEVAHNRLPLEPDVIPVQRGALAVRLEVVASLQQPAAVMERPQILALEFLRQVLGGEPRQIRLEQLHAVLAEAAAVAGREDGQVSFVKLDARDTRVDLDPDDGLEVLAPDRVVAVHQVGVVLAVGALDPG